MRESFPWCLKAFLVLHRKCFDYKNYGDWKLQGPCRENLHYLWKRAVKIAGNPHDNYRTCKHHRVSPQFLQPFSIDRADFPCRDPAISSPRSFYGQNICGAFLFFVIAMAQFKIWTRLPETYCLFEHLCTPLYILKTSLSPRDLSTSIYPLASLELHANFQLAKYIDYTK